MNIHNRSILNEYRQNHHIYEQLEITASALLENELNQSGIMGKANWRKKEKRTCRNTSSA